MTVFVEFAVLTIDQYAQLLARLNEKNMHGVKKIVFLAGMDFGDREKWWTRSGRRRRPHEGVDVVCGEDSAGERHFLGEGVKVPSLTSGEIVAICDDFLGQSVLVRGASRSRGSIVAVHAHILPKGRRGDLVEAGEEIGVIAPTEGPVPAHLHLSLLGFNPALPWADIDWQYLNKCDWDLFLDPFA